VYYDFISHRDFKQIKKSLNSNHLTNEVTCLKEFDGIFKNIEDHWYTSINEFYTTSVEAIKNIQNSVKNGNCIDISFGVIPDVAVLLPLFQKV